MWRSFLLLMEGPVIALVTAISYFLTYRINEIADDWALYAQGINLVFLPAGIKHLSILLAGKWGALGCFLSLFVLASEFWDGVSSAQIAFYSAISTGATWMGIALCMRALSIQKDLHNLRFMHLPLMDLVTTAIHGFTTNAFFIWAGMKTENFVPNALAMMFGDYVGSFLILTLLWFALSLYKRYNRPSATGNES